LAATVVILYVSVYEPGTPHVVEEQVVPFSHEPTQFTGQAWVLQSVVFVAGGQAFPPF
jgi:hypothetical protein